MPGPEAITKFWEGSIRAGFKDHTFEIVETRADGNLSYVLSTWTVKKVGGGPNNNEESTLQGHTLRVLLKQSDGTWKTKVQHVRTAGLSGATRSQEVDRLRKPRVSRKAQPLEIRRAMPPWGRSGSRNSFEI